VSVAPAAGLAGAYMIRLLLSRARQRAQARVPTGAQSVGDVAASGLRPVARFKRSSVGSPQAASAGTSRPGVTALPRPRTAPGITLRRAPYVAPSKGGPVKGRCSRRGPHLGRHF
jgi:hypothetical protein